MMMTIIFLALLGAIAVAYQANIMTAIKLGGAEGKERAGFYAAEAGLNVGLTRFVNDFRHHELPTADEFAQELDIGKRAVKIDLAEVAGCSPCPPSRIPAGEIFGGLNTVPYAYAVQSRARDASGNEEAHIGGEFVIHNIPIFQFLAFINDDLFIMPITNTNLHGRLHSNSDVYIDASGGSNTITVGDWPAQGITDVQVTAAGRIYRGGRKYDSSWLCSGTVDIDMFEDTRSPYGDNDPRTLSCGSAGTPLTDATLASWKGSIDQSVSNISTPDVGIIRRGDGDYWRNADLRIVLNLDATPAVIDFTAGDLCPGAPNTGMPSLYPVQVQDAGGGVNVDKTRALWRFMCERRGAIFYTEIPNNTGDPGGSTGTVSGANDYSPNFSSNATVYRRAGEDTNGDGVVGGNDSNVDICPPPGAAYAWWAPSNCAGVTAPSNRWYADMDYRRGGFWNHREEQWMRLLNVNVRALIDWNERNGDVLFPHDDATHGGLVFFLTVAGPDSTAARNNYGARVFDSADLNSGGQTFPYPPPEDPTGLTIVSDQAVLIGGNYNRVQKYPAAIMGDAIYTLSQGWETPSKSCGSSRLPNDMKSATDLRSGHRDVPSRDCPGNGSFSGNDDLVVNGALLFGLGASTRNSEWYNGGLENFPKYVESWSGRTLNYRGSFVSLGKPQHKRNNWACGSGDACNIYDPPGRDFDYEPLYNQVEWLPPMTPNIVYAQQRLYTRFFK